jgi:hypothetical protein
MPWFLCYSAAGVSCGTEVEVRCTISSVTVSVPRRYLLQLFLPFCIKDEAESVKFSSKKQPPTLTVTLAVDSSLVRPAATPLAASASAFAQRSSAGRQGVQQQQQQQPAAFSNNSSSSIPPVPPSDDDDDLQPDWSAEHAFSGPRDTWPPPLRVAADWVDSTGASDAGRSLLWLLNPHSPPPEDEPEDLLPLTMRTVVLGVVALLMWLVMAVSAHAYVVVSGSLLQVVAARVVAVYD